MSLDGKHIVIGISGGIAAYKMATVVRLLRKEKASVQVIMTERATHFITPLTLSTLSNAPVLVDYYDSKTGEWNNHVHIAAAADLLLIAPATANTIAKCAAGLCDNLLQAVYLSTKNPVCFAPAMDLDMWKHPSTRHNIDRLVEFGHHIIPPTTGELASGLVGEGRLAEPQDILAFIQQIFSASPQPLKGKKALVTAGPTYQAIDPVRFIGNHSTGKMGYAIAEHLARQGAEVTLVSGPTSLAVPAVGKIQRVQVTSAQEMLEACTANFQDSDILVMSAAVADYTPIQVAEQKIKKSDSQLHIELEKTTDILATLGAQKKPGQLVVGFALETQNELENAQGKLARKNLDFIVLNSMRDSGAGFAHDTNKVTVVKRSGEQLHFPLKSKSAVAEDIVALIAAELPAKDAQSARR
ncbi:MAG TPA: bifunctional phosphopantothenoylcysteine decarboxylase/phosphopantothenate--cysteine ligase CoaBC [Candidatus Sphingobacterium stercorigallinarum]|nr:bifunctional phosphopantothenoylcysteine decarboxylase/phosphopantothenate--cysteine ligase CoaBC [Candidatus Sphingobacterium stercorigallinarum]